MKRFLILWSLLAAALWAASLSCVYEPVRLNVPEYKYWESTGIVIRAESPDTATGRLRISWTGFLAETTDIPPEKPDPIAHPPGGSWTESLPPRYGSFENLAAGGTVELYSEQPEVVADLGSVLKPGKWVFSFSIWEDGCPVVVACRQDIGGRIDSTAAEESQTQPVELTVNRYECSAADGLVGNSTETQPRLPSAETAAIAPIDEYRPGSPPCRWTERWSDRPNEWTVAVDSATGKRVLAETPTSDAKRLLTWDYLYPSGQVEILAKLQAPDNSYNFGAFLYIGIPGAAEPDNGYAVGLYDGRLLRSYRVLGNNWSDHNAHGYIYDNNTYSWIRFRVTANSVQAKVWLDGVNEPGWPNGGWQIDNTHLATGTWGWVGVGTDDITDRPRFEWFSVGLGGATAPGPSTQISLPSAPRPGRPPSPPRRPRQRTAPASPGTAPRPLPP